MVKMFNYRTQNIMVDAAATKWDDRSRARFVIGAVTGIILIVAGTIRIFLMNQLFLFDSIVGVIEILVGLFLIGVGYSPEWAHNFLISIFNMLRGLLGKS